MSASDTVAPSRSDVVGSLLRPPELLKARRAARDGAATIADLRAAEDRAVLEAIALQERAGLDVITDGEFRRSTWIATLPMLRPEPEYQAPLAGTSLRAVGAGWWGLWRDGEGERAALPAIEERAIVTEPLTVARDIVSDEYAFLARHARARAKYTIPAPSWHRIFWDAEHSRAAYPTAEDFLRAVRDYLREEVVAKLVALGCDYIQLDAPNYAQWHVHAENRAVFESWGHDMAAELAADAEIDNSVFEGVEGITRAIHICRGNGGRRWFASGGYDAIAGEVFPRLTNVDRLLLEYDTPRAGTFAPLRHLLPAHTAVLGLVTTKDPALEDLGQVEARIDEATAYMPLERLALSPQCGFASGATVRILAPDQQEAKLRLIVDVARRVWRE